MWIRCVMPGYYDYRQYYDLYRNNTMLLSQSCRYRGRLSLVMVRGNSLFLVKGFLFSITHSIKLTEAVAHPIP